MIATESPSKAKNLPVIFLVVLLAAGAAWAREPTSNAAAEPLPGIVFVSGAILGPEHEMNGYLGGYHWRDSYIYPRSATYHELERTITPTRPGRNLYTLVPAGPDGVLTQVTHLSDGEVFDPEPSYDGRRILFSMRRDGDEWFHLYEINVDGTELRQLTDGPFNDVSGVYLPDGRIVFVSDRTGYLEEYHEERTEALYAMNADGTGIEQITFNPGTVFDPTVLSDGRILFSLWDAFQIDVPPSDKHETYLVTIRPDGTEERHLFGAAQYRFFNKERHSGVGLTQAGEMPDGTILVQSEMGPSILDPTRGTHIEDALRPIFPPMTSIQLGGTTNRVHLSPLGTRSEPYPLQDGRFLFSGTLPGARDMALYVADPKTRAIELLYNDPTTSEYDARPILVERPKPPVIPPKPRDAVQQPRRPRVVDERPWYAKGATGRARFLVVNARRAENPEHEKAMQKARYLRVIETEYTGLTVSSHTNLEMRILGVVPILPDGSAYFEAPADTPLSLEALDAAGRRILYDWNYPVTSVPVGSKQAMIQMAYMTGRAGEVKSCYGCHAPQDETPPAGQLLAMQLEPVVVDRDLTDIMYRRNEPDEYRLQARIGEAGKYRPWLESGDPYQRALACETLMQIEDGARQDAATIAGLLDDEAVDVRRAAALALTRLATVEQIPKLLAALNDSDWLVRFHADVAMEVLSGETGWAAGIGGVYDPQRPAEQQFGDTAAPDSHDHWKTWWNGHEGAIGFAEWLAEWAPQAPQPTWMEAAGRLGREDAILAGLVRSELHDEMPPTQALRAAGLLRDTHAIDLLSPWLSRHEDWYHATEAALALGRIGNPEAVAALWSAVRSEVPIKQVYISRYLQHGPRPEEYALLRGLIFAGAKPTLEEVPFLIAMLPGTFLEKPRFEDRVRPESQRVLLPRVLLENGGFRKAAVELLVDVLRSDLAGRGGDVADAKAPEKVADSSLYQQILAGINLERPFSEHGRVFPVLERIEAEQALWLLTCLATEKSEVPEELLVPYLTLTDDRPACRAHRCRIDAAVLLGLLGAGPDACRVLAEEAAKPYGFSELESLGKGAPFTEYRDKGYFAHSVAWRADDLETLRPLLDAKRMYRDIRYAVAVGLGRRGTPDGIPVLSELATHDPIWLVRRHARMSLEQIQQAQRLAGHPVPDVELPDAQPMELLYPAGGVEHLEPLAVSKPEPIPAPATLAALEQAVREGLKAEHYRNLNNAQVQGAEHMMISGIAPFAAAMRALASGNLAANNRSPETGATAGLPSSAVLNAPPLPKGGPEGVLQNSVGATAGLSSSAADVRPAEADDRTARQLITTALDSPYPLAHYLALQTIAQRVDRTFIPQLVEKLDAFGSSGATVGFYWTAETLGRLDAEEALDVLTKYAQPVNPPGVMGPLGMGTGYAAAKAIAAITGDATDPRAAALLASDNVWLRAGALAGLVEARAPGVEGVLSDVLAADPPAVVAAEAQVGLERLRGAQ